jgi:hypothetical protein
MRRRGRAVGLGASAAAFLAFGLTPLGTAPAAHADFGFDWLIDMFDPGAAAGVDPTGGLDWDFASPLAEGDAFQSFYHRWR